ncbi:hypothetical protein UP10_18825 [Bradyrhizobium sp. LTSPM299]|nr:hypothetical protein UP10_18825 [Bradyrhizobium sp. LTSPM299]
MRRLYSGPAEARDCAGLPFAPVIAELQAAGVTSLRAAAGLNERGMPTARGSGEWSAVQLWRVLERFAEQT